MSIPHMTGHFPPPTQANAAAVASWPLSSVLRLGKYRACRTLGCNPTGNLVLRVSLT